MRPELEVVPGCKSWPKFSLPELGQIFVCEKVERMKSYFQEMEKAESGSGIAGIAKPLAIKVYRKIKKHETVCIDTKWRPLENSKVATAGWDAQIKYWD